MSSHNYTSNASASNEIRDRCPYKHRCLELVRAEADNERLREGIASAMTSLATGPLRDGYAYSVLDAALGGEEE